ncbi:MAG: nucleotidyltransferase domain-containing protein [Nanoarchaeota archaeon]
MELIKPIIQVGNSAGVILPKKWLNGEAKIILIKKPQNIKQEVLSILEEELPSIIGLYVVGSYARREQNAKSDIDILGITTNVDKRIKKGKYEIILISHKKLERALKENILPLLPMLREALPIINKNKIEEYGKYSITKNNIKWHIETTISALKLAKETIDFFKEDNKNVSDNIIYSLVLRLREVYIVKCLIQNKIANNSELISIIKDICGSLDAYKAYQRSKSGIKAKKRVSIKEAESIYNYALFEIEEQRKWIKRKD